MTTGATIAITGAAGFLGTALTRQLLKMGEIAIAGEAPRPIAHILLLDLVSPPADLLSDVRVRALPGDLDATIPTIPDVDLICHLAGIVSSAAESEFELGMRTNLDTLRLLLDHARAMSNPPAFVFTSSLAVFGNDPAAIAPIGTVRDDTIPTPQSSYGVQKLIGELLVADYTRRGFVRGRSVRLMTVAVRPGKPNAAASSFISGIIREPLAGVRATCPVPPATAIALSSPSRTIAGILAATTLDRSVWGSTCALTLPALTITPAEMLEALDRITGRATSALVDWEPDEAVMGIVGNWPSRFHTPRATALGLAADDTFDDIVREYLRSSDRTDTPAPSIP